MIEKINNDQMQNFVDKAEDQKAKSEKVSQDNDESVSLHVNYADLLDKAMEIPPEDSNAIERARELLLCGQLDSPDNIQAAAENIAMFGI